MNEWVWASNSMWVRQREAEREWDECLVMAIHTYRVCKRTNCMHILVDGQWSGNLKLDTRTRRTHRPSGEIDSRHRKYCTRICVCVSYFLFKPLSHVRPEYTRSKSHSRLHFKIELCELNFDQRNNVDSFCFSLPFSPWKLWSIARCLQQQRQHLVCSSQPNRVHTQQVEHT